MALNFVRRLDLYEQLIDASINNIPLGLYFEKNLQLNQRIKNRRGIKFFTKVLEDFNAEGDLLDVLKENIPNDELVIIRLAKDSGALLDGLRRAEDLCKVKRDTSEKIKRALTGPTIMFLVVLVVIGGYAAQVFPKFEVAIPVEQWPDVTSVLYNLGLAIFSTSIFIFFAVCWGIYFAIAKYFKHGIGPLRNSFNYWPLASIYTNKFTTMFLGVMAGMVKLNTSIADTFTYISESTDSKWLKSHMDHMMARQEEGMELGEVFNTGLLSMTLIAKLGMYGESADLAETLDKIYQVSIVELNKQIDKLTGAMKSISTLLIGGVAVWIYLAIFGLTQNFG